MFVYFTIAPKAALHYSWEYDKMANPVIGFFENEKFIPENELFTIESLNNPKESITKNTATSNYQGMTPNNP
jgi:hypothetical protein